MSKIFIVILSLVLGLNAFSKDIWNLEKLFKTPRTFKVNNPKLQGENGIKPIFFEGVPYKGKSTKVFAWYGIPKKRSGKVPGIVLVHGGGGTAFKSWVKLWVNRGYAAIAIDTDGEIPIKLLKKGDKKWKSSKYAGPWVRNENGGPGLRTVFGYINRAVGNQWTYHAVSAVILANSLLRSMPEVDSKRIGLTGISWGGYLTNIVAGLDNRFCFAVPVYGCGFLGDNSSWKDGSLRRQGIKKAQKWLKLWDPSNYLGQATMPMLFCNGTNDPHYRPDSWQKTYRLVKTPCTLAMRVRMKHGHPPHGDPPEITVFANSITKKGIPLTKITEQGISGSEAWVKFESKTRIVKAVLNYTTNSGCWTKRKWESKAAKLNSKKNKYSSQLPNNWTAYYFNIYDNRNCLVSSEHQTKK
jgi:dienelactone hydrolase